MISKSPRRIIGTSTSFNKFTAGVGSIGTGKAFGDIYSMPIDLKDQVCVEGKGAYDFNSLCNFTCSFGYCPIGACTCEQMVVARTEPKATGMTGYPAEWKDPNYIRLCSFACNYDYCPSEMCEKTEHAMPIPAVLDFLPPACCYAKPTGHCELDAERAIGYLSRAL